MYDQAKPQNAVAAIRVSTTKQGTEGDSPEAQREQIEQFAAARNIAIKKIFVFLESASQEQQPIQEAINYCKQPKNHIQLFIVKSIDRFTRGGSYSYSSLKMQLDKADVRLMDIYGIIGTQKINTLEHLGLSYSWSVYDPTKNSELLEAERAHDEKRDIMSRMIGAQIRYARLGYHMRRPPVGYRTVTAETLNGKRCLLEPEPIESHWIITMFELRARGTMTDHQIVEAVNSLGFKTRLMYARDKRDHGRIIGRKGGRPLTVKLFQQYIHSPIYAGVIAEKWTLGRAVRSKSPALVSIETFNKANRGKLIITQLNGEIVLQEGAKPVPQTAKGIMTDHFPYRRVVGCSICGHPLTGSFSRGRLGKRYPGYHCSGRGHYFRVPKKQFDEVINAFLARIQIAPEYQQAVLDAVMAEWDRRQMSIRADEMVRAQTIDGLKLQAKLAAEKIKYLDPRTIGYIEKEIRDLEAEIVKLEVAPAEVSKRMPSRRKRVIAHTQLYVEQPKKTV